MYVLDSSALLAVINQETGHEPVLPMLVDSVMSTVNIAEVFTKLAEKNVDISIASKEVSELGIEIVDFDFDQGVTTAELRPKTKQFGLSLGDRACLALAIQKKYTAVTTDKVWAKLKVCDIKVVR